MKNLASTIVCSLVLLSSTFAVANEWVNGYYRSDGIYVQGHYRSSPDSSRYDNYSSKGNVNPYTGKKGTQRHEFSNPSIYDYNYGKKRKW